MKTVTRRGFVGVCASGLWLSACLSPTLPPLPPPSEPEMRYEAAGELRLQGMISAERSVTVFAVNNHSGAVGGRVVRDGAYSFRLEAEPGDEIELWYQAGAKVSESLFLEAPPHDPTAPNDSTVSSDVGRPADAGRSPVESTATVESTADSGQPDAGLVPDAGP